MQSPILPRAVDSHLHVFSATALAIEGARYRPAYAARLEEVRALWRENAISHGVIVQPSFFGTDNAETLAAVAADREHLRAVVVVDPSIPEEAIARLDAQGAVAVRLNLKSVADYAAFGSDAWLGLFARLHKRGWHLEAFVDAGRLPEFARAIERAEIAVVFDHFGNPGTDEAAIEATFAAVEALAARRFVGAKLSGPYRLGGTDRRDLAARWLDAVGPANLVWGSDWPWTAFEQRNDYRRLRDDLARWVGAALAPAILWDNAARLYRFA